MERACELARMAEMAAPPTEPDTSLTFVNVQLVTVVRGMEEVMLTSGAEISSNEEAEMVTEVSDRFPDDARKTGHWMGLEVSRSNASVVTDTFSPAITNTAVLPAGRADTVMWTRVEWDDSERLRDALAKDIVVLSLGCGAVWM